MEHTSNRQNPSQLLRLATNASVTTAFILIAAKLTAWFITGSLSVLASLVDSLTDAAASLFNLFAVRYSLKSADEEHQFGHGKAESLAGLAQASFIMGSAVLLIIHTIERLKAPTKLGAPGIGIAVMLFAILATILLLTIQYYVIKRTNSTAIRADALHYKTDLLTNIVTITALIFSGLGWPLFDPFLALCIAGYIVHSAWRIGKDAAQTLMDRQLPQDIRDTICKLVLSHSKVLGLHDLRTRQSGQTEIIQLHLNLDDEMPLIEAHTVAKEVEHLLLSQYPCADILIHQDPVGILLLQKSNEERECK